MSNSPEVYFTEPGIQGMRTTPFPIRLYVTRDFDGTAAEKRVVDKQESFVNFRSLVCGSLTFHAYGTNHNIGLSFWVTSRALVTKFTVFGRGRSNFFSTRYSYLSR